MREYFRQLVKREEYDSEIELDVQDNYVDTCYYIKMDDGDIYMLVRWRYGSFNISHILKNGKNILND